MSKKLAKKKPARRSTSGEDSRLAEERRALKQSIRVHKDMERLARQLERVIMQAEDRLRSIRDVILNRAAAALTTASPIVAGRLENRAGTFVDCGPGGKEPESAAG
jgi:hypothetical protein